MQLPKGLPHYGSGKNEHEPHAALDAQWNADYFPVEAAWRLAHARAGVGHQKPPEHSLKPPRPKVITSIAPGATAKSLTESSLHTTMEAEGEVEQHDQDKAESLTQVMRGLELEQCHNVFS